jgi:cell wall-associated NlpC family hydrolase
MPDGEHRVMKNRRSYTRPLLICGALLATAVLVVAMRRFGTGTRPVFPPTAQMIAAAAQLDLGATSRKAPGVPTETSRDREKLLVAAHAKLGTPYKFGAKGPERLDCSGFTKVAYEGAGVHLPDGSFNQAKGELPLEALDDLRPGDLLFYRWPGHKGVTHVTMYWGEGWVIGTGSPRQPSEVTIYPLASDFAAAPGTVVTYRHIALPDES